MDVFVPFDPRDPNSRLSSVLSADQRRAFAAAMLTDVLDAIRATGREPTILSTADLDRSCAVVVDDRPLTEAVNGVLDATTPAAVVMADLPLVTPEAVDRLLDADAAVTLAPGLGGGTNALCARHPGFRVDYHDGSYRKHLASAEECGASVHTLDSFRLAVDVDERADLAEVLLHGEGEAAAWLRDAGFEIEITDGRCTVSTAAGGR
ncbi:2-phospho-L-lactate guanylyltransferase [Halovenus sp. WSH3]|uniref:2-phospho-L-lactate guanylyltransferase n=1 Tax=Halovenus carboxidivorans TaxID=2692199 RepID=A0A6B0TAE1_9EURY|nr:2-phospho-L-lactate guanylyltransferase [Halovenus carboxidivorans]MXR51850.1 2-phospho-L-lactate guanylyltransferase [Halovenus carboxidivorans]